ncbi:hypothetical protein LSTR_LSTR002280 [Laodelphax striatellus]|uniref:Uncharacterized protein n=1 Tax=Laodelphax striatellus TaxID=195883 RepID=A0A482XFJ4_LAOST|nr:hypothetical protein LSTR_LSTR002280 [Laodelphax striatellus]
MLNVESIGPLQDEDSITLDDSKDFVEELPQFPFLINPIHCYNSKDNMSKATKKDDKQESSSESGGIFGFLNSIRAGCSRFQNRRNSDDDSAKNNNNKSSPQQQKSPIKSSGNDGPHDRYGTLGKEGLQQLNEQRELEKLRKRQSQQPSKTMTPIEKLREEQEQLKKQDKAGKGKPLDASNIGPAKKPKLDNKDNQVEKADASNFPEDNKLKSSPVDGGKSQIPNKELSPNVSNIGKEREMKGKDKEGEKHPDMNKSDIQQPINEMPPERKRQLKPSNDESPLKERKKPDQSASSVTPDGGNAEMRRNAPTPSSAGTIPAKENQLKQDNDKKPLEEKGKADKLASNLSPDANQTAEKRNDMKKPKLKPSNDESPLKERKKPDQSASNVTPDGGNAEMKRNAPTPSPAGTIPAKENQLKQDNDKKPLEEKGKADKLASNLSPDANQTAEKRNDMKKPKLKPSNDESPLKERKKPDQSASNVTPDGGNAEMKRNAPTPSPAGTIPAKENQLKQDNDKKPLEEKGKADKLASNLSPDANQTAEKRNDMKKPIQEPPQADRMQIQQSGQPNKQNVGENEFNPIKENERAKKDAYGIPSNVRSAEPQNENQSKMQKANDPDLSKRSERPGKKSEEMNLSKNDQKIQEKPAKDTRKVDKLGRDVSEPVADSGTTEGGKVKESPVQPSSEMSKVQGKRDPINATTPDKADGQPHDSLKGPQTQPKSGIDKSDLDRRPESTKKDKPDGQPYGNLKGPQTQPKSGIDKSDLDRRPESTKKDTDDTSKVDLKKQEKPVKGADGQPRDNLKGPQTQPKSEIDKPSDEADGQPRDNSKGPQQTQPKSGIDKSDLDRRPKSTKKEPDVTSKVGLKKQERPVKEDPTKGGLESMLKVPVPHLPVSPAASEKETPAHMKGTEPKKSREKPESDVSTISSRSSLNYDSNETLRPSDESSAVDDKGKPREKPKEVPKKRKLADSNKAFPYDPEIIRERLKNQIKTLREEGCYTDSELDDMDDEIYQTVMSYGAQTTSGKMSITSESSLSLPSLSSQLSSFSSSSNVVKDLWTVLRKRSKSELNVVVRPVKRNRADRPMVTTGKMTTIGEAQYVDYESTAFDLNLPTKYKVSTEEVEGTLLMNFDPERKAMSGDKCFRLYKHPERGHQISIPISDLQIPVFVYETDNDPEGILVTDQVIRSKLQVCLEVASMYYDEISVKRGRLLVHLAEYAPSSVIGFLRQLAEAIVNRRINSKPKINGFLNKCHEMSSADRTILKKDLGDKPELDNFRLLSRLKTKVFSEFYRRVGYWELVEGEKEVSHKHLFLIRHMPRLYKTGLYPFIDFISEYIANNQIRTLDQLEVALIRFLVCSDGVITKSEFNTFCDFGLKKKC